MVVVVVVFLELSYSVWASMLAWPACFLRPKPARARLLFQALPLLLVLQGLPLLVLHGKGKSTKPPKDTLRVEVDSSSANELPPRSAS